MKLSAKAEYACVAMAELAVRHQRNLPTSLKVIAETYGISQGFLMQIFMQLKGSGFVQSVRGATGGYQLARAPKDIKLSEIVDAIDGPPSIHSALNTASRMALATALQEVWEEIHLAERQVLDEVNLAELVRRAQESGELDFQI